MKKMIPLLALAFFAACKSGSNKYDAVASDMCGCFNKLKDSIPADALKVFETAATAENAKSTYETELKKLPPESLQKTMRALMATSSPSSPVGECLKEIDKKHSTMGIKQDEAAQKMVDALKGKSGCELMMTLMRMQVEKSK